MAVMRLRLQPLLEWRIGKELGDVDYEIRIKRTNVERCVQHCNSVGVAVTDLEKTVLNFFASAVCRQSVLIETMMTKQRFQK